MSTPRQTPALILRTVNYGDNHVIVHLLGRDTGRVSAIAHGARSSRRRFSGCLEPLRVVEASLREPRSGDLYRLDELEVTQDFPGIDERIETISAASYGTELTRETWREGEASEQIFELLRRFYEHLPECATNRAIARLVHQFEYHLLHLYGLAPTIHHCARCGATPETMDKFRFSRSGEGLICADCRHDSDATGVVSSATLDLLHHLADPECPLPTDDLDAALHQTERVLTNAVDQLVERALVSRTMLRQMLAF